MDRQESLEHFYENVSKKLINECKLKFQENFKEDEEKVKFLIIDGMKNLIKKAEKFQKINKDYKISVFQFELLRINILNDSFNIFIHGYNSLWYLDNASIFEEIDLKFLFTPFIKFKNRLAKEKKIYMGKVNDYDIAKVIFDLAADCFKSMSERARDWFWNIDEEVWMRDGAIGSFYIIKWSEYQGKSETLFAMDNKEKTIKELLELKKEPEEKLPFVYTVWKDSTLADGELTKQNMLFINFKGSKLKKINFSESDIIRSQFKNTHLKDCIFKDSRLIAASFENAVIEDSDFSNTDCTGVDFGKSQLSYVDFKDANLKNAVFTNASLKNVSFEGAEVEDSIFSEKDIPFIHLTSEQLQTIYIDGGDE